MKSPLGILLLISVLGNAVLLYRVFDLGVTTTYGSDEIRRRSQQAADAEKLLPSLVSGTSRMDLLNAAQKTGLEVLDKGEEGLYVGGIHFVLSGDRVAAVKFE
jgi:hypothetical protein